MPERVVVAGWIGSTNLGDELIFAAMRQQLEQLGADITALSINPFGTETRHGVEAIGHRGPRDGWNLTKRLTGQDVMVLGGGGIVQDQSSPWNLPFHMHRVRAARRAGMGWGAVGLGVDRLRSRWAKQTASRGLRDALVFTVRDEASADAVQLLGLTRPVVAADLALSLPEVTGPGRDRLVVCLRPPVRPGLVTAARKARHTVDERWESHVAAAIDVTCDRLGLEPTFVAFQRDRDGPLHRRIADRLERTSELLEPSLAEIVQVVASGRAVLAMRYHAAISALLARRPAVLIGYSPKVLQLAGEVGPGFETHQRGSLSADALTQLAERALASVARLDESFARLKQRERGNRAALERLLEGS